MKLFIAGIVPGILLMLLYMLTIYILVIKNPSLAPVADKDAMAEEGTIFKSGLVEIFLHSLYL